MNKKCKGCGAILQTINPDKEGYIQEININTKDICERCFRIKHYNDYKIIEKTNNEYIEILKKINEKPDLVLMIIDVFNINNNIKKISDYISNDILLVLTKSDIIPLSVKEEKIINYVKKYNLNVIDTILVSSKKNYNLDSLMEKIQRYQKSKDVYVIGYTNAGKSTLINKIISNYTESDANLTISILPSTTLDMNSIKINESLNLIDTPGLIEDGNIMNIVDAKTLKKLIPKKEIKPLSYQIKTKQTITIDSLATLELNNTDIIIYMSNNLEIKRYYKQIPIQKEFEKHELKVKKGEDLVISGLGFIKICKSTSITIYTLKGINVFTRESLI